MSVPSRPTVSNGTDTTRCGILEVEYGLERQWPGSGVNRDDLSGGLRFGLLRNLDFHWQSADFLHIMDSAVDHTGFGDTWLGLKYRFLSQTKSRPGLGFFYQVKVPSANSALGFGTGKMDHAFSVLVSKDIRSIHFDFNATPFLAGRPGGSGLDHNVGFALSASAPLPHGLGIVAEGYGYSFLNQDNPAFAASMLAFTFQAGPRLVFDTGLDVGVTHYAPHKRVFVGITYAIANLYGRKKRDPTLTE